MKITRANTRCKRPAVMADAALTPGHATFRPADNVFRLTVGPADGWTGDRAQYRWSVELTSSELMTALDTLSSHTIDNRGVSTREYTAWRIITARLLGVVTLDQIAADLSARFAELVEAAYVSVADMADNFKAGRAGLATPSLAGPFGRREVPIIAGEGVEAVWPGATALVDDPDVSHAVVTVTVSSLQAGTIGQGRREQQQAADDADPFGQTQTAPKESPDDR